MKTRTTTQAGTRRAATRRKTPSAKAQTAEKLRARPLLKLKKILVPTDFSDFSAEALTHAIPFASQFGAEIVLVHVIEPHVNPVDTIMPPEIEDVNLARQREARQELARLRDKTLKPNGIRSRNFVRIGQPYHEIVELARSSRANLIVIATHGYTGLKHFYLGSTAERVVRHAPCPVLVVREPKHSSSTSKSEGTL